MAWEPIALMPEAWRDHSGSSSAGLGGCQQVALSHRGAGRCFLAVHGESQVPAVARFKSVANRVQQAVQARQPRRPCPVHKLAGSRYIGERVMPPQFRARWS